MESQTYIKNVKISPRKLRFYLKAVKKMTPEESLKFLYYGKQRGTRVLYKAIESAIANATRALKTETSLLNFKLLTVEGGLVAKRYKPGARGNVRPILKRMSHVKIVLETKEVKKAATPVQKKEETKKLEVEKPAAVKKAAGKVKK
jgi:large subunit ribosomal protein L22